MIDHARDAESVFLAALDRATPQEWAAFAEEACAGKPALLQRVRQLLEAHAESQGPLDVPPAGLGATVDLPPLPERPGTLIGPYQLLEPLGEGGMGTVWLAQQTEPVQRQVALKLIKAGLYSQPALARFEAERQVLALMDHPNIAKVHDAGTTPDGHPYFVMELVQGVPITRYCDEHRLTPRQRLELFVPVCQAIQHAHQKGIIHRDLKPSNVLVTRYDERPVPKVIDFGVAKATGPQLTEQTLHTGFGAVVGTPEYMSPEQASCNALDVDTRSDIYALGVLLYELLAGSPPFSRKELEQAGVLEMLRVIREQEPPRPSTRLSTAEGLPTLAANRGTEPAKLTKLVRGDLDWIVLKALEKDRSRRYETASAFAADVQRYLKDEAVHACPPSALYRFRKFSRRNRGALTAGVVIATALLLTMVVLALSTAWVWKENQAKNTALELAERRREAAEKARGKALEAVERMLTRVADEWVAAIPQMQGVRKSLLEDAAALYTDLIALNPGDAQAYHERGWVYILLARNDQARADFERATELEPDNPEYHGTLATLLTYGSLFQNKPRSLHHARRMVELRPTDALARGILAQAYLSAGQTNEGVAELRKGAELARGTALEHKLLAVVEQEAGNWRNVIAHLQQVRESPPPDMWVYRLLAEAHLALGEDAQALAAIDRGVELGLRHSDEPAGPSQVRGRYRGIRAPAPTSEALAGFYELRCKIHLRQKKYASAEADFNNYLNIYADRSARWPVYRDRALAHFDQGHYEQALADLARAIEIKPDEWHLYKHRALAHFHLGHYEQALADVARPIEAIAIRPDDFYNVLWISADLVVSCPDEKFRAGMLALADKAIKRAPGNAGGYFARGHLYRALQQYDKARADFKKAVARVEREATDVFALYEGAWFLATCSEVEFRDPKRAVTLARKAVALEPTNWYRRNALGVAHYRAGDCRAAVVALEKSMELGSGGDSFVWFFLAMAHWQLGDRQQARTWYGKAVAGMDQHRHDQWREEGLKRFRAEAAELLGVKDPPSRKEIAPSKP
jgi:serine/threonine protein kinase/Flp pilus assembly protein TadD